MYELKSDNISLRELAELCLKGFSNRVISVAMMAMFEDPRMWCQAFRCTDMADGFSTVSIFVEDQRKVIRRTKHSIDINDGTVEAAVLDLGAKSEPLALEIIVRDRTTSSAPGRSIPTGDA